MKSPRAAAAKVRLSASQERYLETLADLTRRGGARTADVAARLGIAAPSVTQAVTRLVAAGLAERRSRHAIVLTARGARAAAGLSRREAALRRFISGVMGLPPARAESVACRLEHAVDPEFARRLGRIAARLQRDYPAVARALSRRSSRGAAAEGAR